MYKFGCRQQEFFITIQNQASAVKESRGSFMKFIMILWKKA
jgi:hypothetical protein